MDGPWKYWASPIEGKESLAKVVVRVSRLCDFWGRSAKQTLYLLHTLNAPYTDSFGEMEPDFHLYFNRTSNVYDANYKFPRIIRARID